jgi:hypothetical protein
MPLLRRLLPADAIREPRYRKNGVQLGIILLQRPGRFKIKRQRKTRHRVTPAFAVVVEALRYRRSQADPSDKTGQIALIPVHKRGMRQTRD